MDSHAPPPPLLPKNRGRWWFHLALFSAYPLILGVLGSVRAPARGPALGHGVRHLVIVCLLELLVFGVVFGLAWLASRASRDDLLLRWRGGPWVPLLSLAYSIGLRIAVAIIVMVTIVVVATGLVALRLASPESLQRSLQANRPDVEALVDVTALRQNPLYFWLSATLASFVVAGFREELWRSGFLAGMRQLWPRQFGSRAGQLAAAAVGAVLFGLGHLAQGPSAVFVTGLLGFGLGAIMVLHRSIWPAVLAHGFFDATSFALLALLSDSIRKVIGSG